MKGATKGGMKGQPEMSLRDLKGKSLISIR